MWSLVHAALFLQGLPTGQAQAPPKPMIPTQWMATIDPMISGVAYQGNGTATIWMDVDNNVMRAEYLTDPYDLGLILNTTTASGLNASCHFMAGVGRQSSSHGKVDMFTWLNNPFTKYDGKVPVPGGEGDSWSLHLGQKESWNLVVQDNVPIRFWQAELQTDFLDPTGPKVLYNSTYIFKDFTPTSTFPPWAFDGECPPAVECEVGGIKNLTIYRFHEDNFEGLLANQDVGDLRGDTFFVCAESRDTPQFVWLSKFEITINTTWGRYAICNGAPPFCFGGDTQLVGREGALALSDSPYAGQCGPNPVTGDWYSMPKAGQCADDQQVGDECSWKLMSRVKTINGTCLSQQQKFFAACAEDGSAPFLKAEAAFLKAFDDEAEGGCPAINPPAP